MRDWKFLKFFQVFWFPAFVWRSDIFSVTMENYWQQFNIYFINILYIFYKYLLQVISRFFFGILLRANTKRLMVWRNGLGFILTTFSLHKTLFYFGNFANAFLIRGWLKAFRTAKNGCCCCWWWWWSKKTFLSINSDFWA